MPNEIEIYVRHNNNDTMLNFYLPEQLKSELTKAVTGGQFRAYGQTIHLELSILPEWITDHAQRDNLSKLESPVHLKIPITCINGCIEG